ncbi:MAG TPA: hypothetical protein VFQ35_07480 [Polyangiaceae bacterium]|nr:hypothetical protein [Polyangiaceae bacterium]
MKFGWLFVAALSIGCEKGPIPCAGVGTCPNGRECLASRCVPEGGAAVPNASKRLLLRPSALGVARAHAESGGMAPGVTLGRRADNDTALYVRFDSDWNEGRVASAFLLLDPLPGSASGEDVALEVWRSRRDFVSSTFGWSVQPGLAPPFARGLARSAPPAPVRVDVTELLRFFATHPSQDHGFVVRATNQSESGVTLATGIDGGAPPRLDVYLE